MKIDRLISIIMVLLERKKISAPELAEMFEVSARTIYRDMETLNLAGIPIISYPGASGGLGIMEEYKVDNKFFTSADITSLLIGLSGISQALSSSETGITLAKIKSLIPATQFKDIELKSNQISIDFNPWAGNRNLGSNLKAIKKALNDRKHLIFEYLSGNGRASLRQVEPYQLAFKAAHWYLRAYCELRADFRTFKLSRISGLKSLDSTFSPREFKAEPLNGSGWIENKLIKVTLLVDESLGTKMADRCGQNNIKPHSPGKILVYLPFTADDYGYELLLGLGDKCECLAPENVRRELIARIRRTLKVYDNRVRKSL